MGRHIIPVTHLRLLTIIFIAFGINTFAQQVEQRAGIDISAGACAVIYQSAFATDNFIGIELTAHGKSDNTISWQAGTRLWFDPVLPELFGRILFTEHIGTWTPAAGIEVGVTGSPDFGEGAQLLRETRSAMLHDIGPFYVSSYIAPLSFTFHGNWGLRVAEINFGTHLKNAGRTLRLNINILSISKTL